MQQDASQEFESGKYQRIRSRGRREAAKVCGPICELEIRRAGALVVQVDLPRKALERATENEIVHHVARAKTLPTHKNSHTLSFTVMVRKWSKEHSTDSRERHQKERGAERRQFKMEHTTNLAKPLAVRSGVCRLGRRVAALEQLTKQDKNAYFESLGLEAKQKDPEQDSLHCTSQWPRAPA
jgi:hypothetical protein